MAYNILVVDDSETVRAVIRKALKLGGVDVGALYQAGNGEEGLAVMRQEWVDLVLADINMPVMGGVKMVEEMRSDESLRELPVIVISTEGSATRLAVLKEKGVSAFLRKPFTPEDIKRAVDSVLEGKSHV